MKTQTIGFIGGGNMARSLIGGLIQSGIAPAQIQVSEPDAVRRDAIVAELKITTASSNQSLLDSSDVVVLAVKPQHMQNALSPLSVSSERSSLFISVAAGLTCKSIQTWLGEDVALVRTMPNTPALVQAAATGMYATASVTSAQKDTAESIMRAVGLTVWVDDEGLLDAVTAVSGSGPAYIFMVMEAMERAGIQLGLKPETARLLTLQTTFGAAKLALEIEEPPETLRHRVTSPGGTTEQAIQVLEQGKLLELFQQALTAAHRRSIELAKELGE